MVKGSLKTLIFLSILIHQQLTLLLDVFSSRVAAHRTSLNKPFQDIVQQLLVFWSVLHL